MSATTINSFPSLHSLSSPRGWALAIIALLHLGFFWALTNGLSQTITDVFTPEPPQYIPIVERPVPPAPKPIDNIKVQPTPIKLTYVPPVVDIPDVPEGGNPPLVDSISTPPDSIITGGGVSPPEPVIVEPRIPSRGLSEPAYPAQEIRLEHEGTVLLAVQILPNGRVGEVKLEKSSGYPKLDESALREARVWRFQPGTRDGVPVAMWKQLPITFRLNK